MLNLEEQQRIQYEHDIKNHFDVISLGRVDRLKHYGLHFAKYAGRLARGKAEVKTRDETIVDAMLVCLSAANALNQLLSIQVSNGRLNDLNFTDAAGRFADACEKIDHLEEFRAVALSANKDIAVWLVSSGASLGLDLDSLIAQRRIQLASRAVYSGG